MTNSGDVTFSSSDGTAFLLLAIFTIPIFIIFPLALEAIRRARLRKLIRARTIITQYEPPKDMSPAEIGYLYDVKLQTNEFVATIFDLEYRGILSIDDSGKITFKKTVLEDLKPHERYILRIIESNKLQTLQYPIDFAYLYSFKILVRTSLIERGYMNKSFLKGLIIRALKMTFLVSPLSMLVFTVWFIFMVQMPLIYIIPFAIAMAVFGTFIFWPLYIFTGMILTAIYVSRNGMYWIGTKQLRDVWSDIEGYRTFIKQVQLKKIIFESEKSKTKAIERDFAYAVALSMEIDWKARFRK